MHPPKEDRFKGRLLFIFALMCILLGAVVVRLAQLSLFQHRYYLGRSIYRTLRQMVYTAPRGNIFDRDGFLLAGDRQALDLQIVLREFNSEPRLIARKVARACGVPAGEVEENLKGLADRAALGEALGEVLIREAVPANAALQLTQSSASLPGVIVRQRSAGLLAKPADATYDVYVYPALAFPERTECVTGLAALLGLTQAAVIERIKSVEHRVKTTPWLVDYVALPLFRGVSFEAIAGVETEPERFTGIIPAKRFQREYAHGSLACHLIGHVGMPSEADLERVQRYQVSLVRPLWKYVEEMNPLVGKSGVEASYDDYLQGRAGTSLVEVDVRERLQRVISEREAVPGKDLYLTIRATYQKVAEEALQGKRGAIVVMDPWTGEILALASSPGYDPNDLVPPVSAATYAKYSSDPGAPFFNRATMGGYPAASVFKVLVAIAALEEGKVDESTTINCTGHLTVGGRDFPCWATWGHGNVSIEEAIENSCNVFFYRMGLALRPELLGKWGRAMGFGELSGIDLPPGGERPGVLPTPEWKRSLTHEGWYAADTLNTAIGQGYLLVTPLQVTVMMAAVANGGAVVTPHLRGGETAKERRVLPISQRTLSLVQRGLEDVVDSGTARESGLRAFTAAGKTGTAQVSGDREPHAWFSGYAPRNNPQVAITVLLEHSGSGGENAAPVAVQVISHIFSGEG